MRRRQGLLMAASLLIAAPGLALAQPYPNKDRKSVV